MTTPQIDKKKLKVALLLGLDSATLREVLKRNKTKLSLAGASIDDAEARVAQRAVEPGAEQGEDTAITKGVTAGERVVVDGLDRLRAGMKVEPVLRTGADAAVPAADGTSPAAAGPGGEHPQRRRRDGVAP